MGTLPSAGGEPNVRERVSLLRVVLPQDDPPMTRSEIEAAASSVISDRVNHELARSDEGFSLGMDDPLRICGSDAPCLARAVRRLHASWGLIVIVDASGDTIRLSLRTFESGDGGELASTTLEVASRAELPGALGAALNGLLDRMGYPALAGLQLRISPNEARVTVEPAPTPPAGSTRDLRVPPGRYTILAELEGYEAKSTELDLRAGQNELLELQLEPREGLLDSPWFWVALGGAAVIAGSIVAVAVASREERWCFSGANRACPE